MEASLSLNLRDFSVFVSGRSGFIRSDIWLCGFWVMGKDFGGLPQDSSGSFFELGGLIGQGIRHLKTDSTWFAYYVNAWAIPRNVFDLSFALQAGASQWTRCPLILFPAFTYLFNESGLVENIGTRSGRFFVQRQVLFWNWH